MRTKFSLYSREQIDLLLDLDLEKISNKVVKARAGKITTDAMYDFLK